MEETDESITTTSRPIAESSAWVSEIAERFPALREVPGVRPFDAVKLAAHVDKNCDGDDMSSSLFCSAMIVLRIAKSIEIRLFPDDRKRGSVRLRQLSEPSVQHVMSMDAEHRAAFGAILTDDKIAAECRFTFFP